MEQQFKQKLRKMALIWVKWNLNGIKGVILVLIV